MLAAFVTGLALCMLLLFFGCSGGSQSSLPLKQFHDWIVTHEANSLLVGIALSSLYSYSCRVCCGLCKLLYISLPSLDPVRMGIALACGCNLHSQVGWMGWQSIGFRGL